MIARLEIHFISFPLDFLPKRVQIAVKLKTVDFRAVLEELSNMYGDKLMDFIINEETGTLHHSFLIHVNGKDVRFPKLLDTQLMDGDRVTIVAPIGGG